MSKKTYVVIFLALFCLVTGGFFINYKLVQRKQRIEAYNAAKNAKAEEISVTILEGWSNKDIAQYLEKQGIITSAEFLASIKNFNAVKYQNFLPKTSEAPLQGFLYPDTYRFFKAVSDRSQTSSQQAGDTIITKLLDNFEAKLPQNAEVLAQKQGLSLYEAITLASIVEKEANNYPNEKRIIAGIFLNRLKIGMALQSDATINYATGKNQPSPSLEDLEINSAYNTYKHKGLPPAPISNPSVKSIEAVLNPELTGYFYYLHDQKTGQPYYAKTYEEHIVNKQKYLTR